MPIRGYWAAAVRLCDDLRALHLPGAHAALGAPPLFVCHALQSALYLVASLVGICAWSLNQLHPVCVLPRD